MKLDDVAGVSNQLLNFPADENLTYNIWRFGNFNILIRCKIDSFLEDETTEQVNKKENRKGKKNSNPFFEHGFRFLCLATKMEYWLFGDFEEMTQSETCEYWSRCYIRPDPHLFLGNVFPLLFFSLFFWLMFVRV
jgi:hypothetical protein